MTAARTGHRRIGVNLLWLVPGVVGGSEEYTTSTMDSLIDLAPDDLELRIFALRPFVEAHPDLVARVETVTLPISGRDKSVRVAAESSWLALQGRRHALDVMHHAGGIMPAVRGLPGVLTVHDVQPLVHPENFSPAKRAFSRVALPRSVRNARLVLSPSENSRRSLIDRIGLHPERTKVVPYGITAPPRHDDDGSDLRRLRARYGLTRPYALFPAITYPHKNHALLVEALARLVDRTDLDLVLTGGEAQEERPLRDLVVARRLEDRVHRLGRIPRADLDAMLRQARVLTFPSRYEGFGIPVLEAMAVGCPVIAADRTALPEVVGDAGVLLDPEDVVGWADAIERVVEDDEHRAALVAAGHRRVAQFSPEASARRLADAYRAVLEMGDQA